MAEWTRASEVLGDDWQRLEELPPSEYQRICRDVARRRRRGIPAESRAGKHLRKAERLLRMQARGELPVPGGRLRTWRGLLTFVDEYLEVARRPKADGQSLVEWSQAREECMARAHTLVGSLLELCAPDGGSP